jgi:large subunit ribosomal protein L15
MITLNTLPKATAKSRKRVGRGQGSNRGKNSGQGDKGQVKRSGKMPVGFEGGMRSLMKRTPKSKGFKINIGHRKTSEVTLGRINDAFADGDIVSFQTIIAKNLANEKIKKIRIINSGEYTKKLTFADEVELHLTKGVQDIIK